MSQSKSQQSSWQTKLDSFIGPGATSTEIALQFVPPVLFSICVTILSSQTAIQKVFASILAFDLLGGVLTNATTAAKTWYHRPDRTKLDHLSFIALHVVHLALVAGIYRGMDVFFFLTTSLFLAVSSVAIVFVDKYIQTPVAMLFYTSAIFLDLYVWKSVPHLPWFIPLFFLKLLISHLLPN